MYEIPAKAGPTENCSSLEERRVGLLTAAIIGAIGGGLCLMLLRALAFDPKIYHEECEPYSTLEAAYHGLIQGILIGAVLGTIGGAMVRGVNSAISIWRGQVTRPKTNAG
jgi:uncharacterized membrane protein YeaQ/YmgE (transglycosylase-associated protein family)